MYSKSVNCQKNPTPKKGGKSTKTVEKNGEVFWDLDKNKRVSVSDFKGKVLYNVNVNMLFFVMIYL